MNILFMHSLWFIFFIYFFGRNPLDLFSFVRQWLLHLFLDGVFWFSLIMDFWWKFRSFAEMFLYSKAVCRVARHYRATIHKKMTVGFGSCLQRAREINTKYSLRNHSIWKTGVYTRKSTYSYFWWKWLTHRDVSNWVTFGARCLLN